VTLIWRLGVAVLLAIAAFLVVACSDSTPPSASVGPAGILLLQPDERVQIGPPTEQGKQLMSDLLVLAQSHGDDLGYPAYDAATGEIVVSVVTPRGRDLITGAQITSPYRVRSVAHGVALLERIKDDATLLRGQGVPGAELIYETFPDYRDNRATIVISAPSQPLLDALAARYPADAIAVQVTPIGVP
jgi:hypothetical protein